MAPFLTNTISTTGHIRSDSPGRDAATDGMSNNAQPGHSAAAQDQAVETEFLVVGAGPAGASLACFLGSHGTHLDLFGCEIRG